MLGEDLVAKLSGVEVVDLMPCGDLASVLSGVEIDDLVSGAVWWPCYLVYRLMIWCLVRLETVEGPG